MLPRALTEPAAWPPDGPVAIDAAIRAGADSGRPFAGVMQEAIAQVSHTHRQAQAQVQSFRGGQTDLRWEEVAQSLQQARLSLQDMVHLRRQLVSAYTGLQDGSEAGLKRR